MHKIIIFLAVLLLNIQALADSELNNQLVYRTAFGGYKDVQILLNQGAEANAQNSLGNYVLNIAAGRNDADAVKIIELLTKNGADPFQENAKGENAITIVIADGTAESVKFLLSWNPLYQMQNSLGDNLEQIAQRRGNEEIIAQIAALKQRQMDELERNTSAENREKLFNQYAFHTCAEQYMKFYYEEGHEKNPDMQKYEQIAAMLKNESTKTLQEISKFFSLSKRQMLPIEKASRSQIVQILAGIGTADLRVRSGVGTNADLQKRCEKIANQISSRATIRRK